jgi:hypothetical protein
MATSSSGVIEGLDTDWHGTIDVVIAASAERVWAVASDWLSFPRRCELVCAEGENGVPGCVRRVQSHNSAFWVAEKLTHIDHRSRFLAYDLVGGNSGIAPGYKAAFQVIAEGESRTRVVWPFMFSSDQASVDTLTDIVTHKVKAHIKELEELAQDY